ncbi:MAG: carbohydrate kinase, partial [Propionivibrio sp.]
MSPTRDLPEFVSFGEALTDLIRTGANHWTSVPGGAPWNVAQVMSSFGVASAFGGGVSQDFFGDIIWQTSLATNLDMRFTQRFDKTPLLAIVHQAHPPKYYFIGEDSADLHFDPAALPAGWEQAVHWVHFGCISLARQPLANRLVELAERLKSTGVRISYDPNFRAIMDERYDPILARMSKIADLIKVSEEDLRGFFRTDDEDAAFACLRSMNPSAPILYTRGAEGAMLYAGDRIWRAVPPEIKVVDSVGAGDCSLAGLLCSLMRNPDADWGTHLRASVAAGTGACLAAGAVAP